MTPLSAPLSTPVLASLRAWNTLSECPPSTVLARANQVQRPTLSLPERLLVGLPLRQQHLLNMLNFINLVSLPYHLSLCVTDTPGKPEVLDVTRNSVTLVWTRPKNDGGSKIIGYYVEAMHVPGDTWIRCNTSSQNVPREEYTVTGLERDLQYQFRVIAKTAVNMSKPSEPTDPILVCAENGERF